MKNFIENLDKKGEKEFYRIDSFQNKMAVLEIWGDKTGKKVTQPEPTRYKMIVFILIEEGYMEARIDYQDCKLEANTLLHLTPSHVIEDVSISPDLKLYMLAVSDEFLQENMDTEKPFPLDFVLTSRHSPGTAIDAKYMPSLIARLKVLQQDIQRRDHYFQKRMVRNAFSSFAFELGNIIHILWKNLPVIPCYNHKEEIMREFMFLLTKNCRKEHNVSFYAEQLCITPEHLSRILKEVSGHTANKWIARALLTEAKILLKNQELSIQQIADELGFSDQFSLSKFFKKNCGVSPGLYREDSSRGVENYSW